MYIVGHFFTNSIGHPESWPNQNDKEQMERNQLEVTGFFLTKVCNLFTYIGIYVCRYFRRRFLSLS
jgi:hypothetical protein